MPEPISDQRKPHARMDLTQGPITRTLLMFSLPVLGTSVLQSLNGAINSIWIGRLIGPEALAATTNATLVLLILLSVMFGIGMASTILVGQAVGAHDLPRAKRVVGAMMIFIVALSLAMAAGGYAAAAPLLHLMGTPAQALALAEQYLRVVFLSIPFLYVFAFLVMVQRGAGDARTPFWFMTLATLLDLVFNPVLIAGIGPFPRLGIAGAATSLLLSQATAMTAMLIYLYWRKADLCLTRHELHYLKPDRGLLWTSIAKGLPMGAQMLVLSSSGLVVMSMINAYGVATAAAYAVATQIWIYVQMPAMAISAGVSSMAAQNVGAKKWDRVEKSARAGVSISVLLTGASLVLIYLFSPLIAGLFLPGQPNAIAAVTHINAIAGWSFILFGATFVLFGVVRATGAVTPPLIILMISLYGARIGFAKLFQPLWGADAIWWSFPASMIVALALTLAYYRWGGWRSARMEVGAPPLTTAAAKAT